MLNLRQMKDMDTSKDRDRDRSRARDSERTVCEEER